MQNVYKDKRGPVGPDPYRSVVGNMGDTGPAEPRCRKYNGFLPNFTPIICSLSRNTSVSGSYTSIRIRGTNFLPNGTTYINFGSFNRLPIVYYSSFDISFVIPVNAPPGIYNIVAVNIYNGNFSPQANTSYPGVLDYSIPIQYTLS
jgi:hypothetical protein